VKITLLLAASLALFGCATSQEVRRPDGRTELLIACGASTGFDVCYRQANKDCPQGYETVSETPGFNRKELRIACAKPN
jgi:hypothetical protein